MIRVASAAAAALAALALGGAIQPASASADVTGLACKLANADSRVTGKACDLLRSPGKILSAGKNLLTGHLGKAFSSLFGGGGGGSSAASTASTALGIAAVVAWAAGGAKLALHETGKVLSETTKPELGSTWFSATYWRMAGIAALLTLPFLFAAAAQALMRSDLALLARAALGYLPLAMLSISIAAPLAMLLLAATDQLCSLVSSPGADGGARALTTGGLVAFLAGAAGAPFITFLFAIITTGGALVLWIELVIREAAVYVIVLMLPLAFAALVWPARRIWAVRAVELLVALILSKFAIVAVLGLGGAALGHSHGLTAALAGTVLVLLGAFAPWAVLRLLPLHELAATAVGSITPQLEGALPRLGGEDQSMPQSVISSMRRHGEEVTATNGTRTDGARIEAERLTRQDDAYGSRTPSTHPAASAPTPEQEASPPTEDDAPSERLPGFGPKWQEPDFTWKPIVLGPEAFEDGRWAGEAFDISGGEERDPLPPSQDEQPL